jgi:hypothetical protein
MLAAPMEPLVTLPDEVYHDIKQVHNEFSGHHGVDRTLRKLMRGGHKWKYMRAHVKFFIQTCPFCQKISHLKIPIHTTPFVTSTRDPMSRISFDSIGILSEDAEWGYNHVLVVIDNFTRWVELYPTRGATATAAARALLDHSGRYGVAAEWVSDRGTQFANEVMEALANLLGTEHCFTLPNSKEENAIVERANKEVMRHLRALLFEAGKFDNWSIFLPFVQRIMNSTVHESIGVAPVQLLMPSVDLDRQIVPQLSESPNAPVGLPVADLQHPLSPWVQNIMKVQARLTRVAQYRVDSHAATHLHPDDNDDHLPITVFPPNSFVLVSYPDGLTKGRPPNKFNTQLKGPHRVLTNVGAKYEILNLVTNKIEHVHVSRLRPYRHTDQSPNPVTVAAKDNEEFLVESILAHTGNPKRYGQMDFLVRWVGSGPADDLYLPWKELRNNPVLHEYLFRVGLVRTIPTEHRAPFLARL